MGLDMYLTGKKFIRRENPTEDGFPVSCHELDLGYWRKHPNLHGYIVQTFADGIDECQDIELTADNLRTLLSAIENDQLPPTSGFFFGVSDGSEKETDLAVIRAALTWREADDATAWRSVHYRASW